MIHDIPKPEIDPSKPCAFNMERSRSGVEATERRRSAFTAPLPLTIIRGSEVGKVKVVPGYVNLAVPTCGGVALDVIPAPEIAITGDVMQVWAKAVMVYPSTFTATIETSEPTPEITVDGWTSGWIIGTVTSEGVITPIHNGGNLTVESFGNINLWWLS